MAKNKNKTGVKKPAKPTNKKPSKRIRKPLTAAQRELKRERDRKYRARLRAAKTGSGCCKSVAGSNQVKAVKPTKPALEKPTKLEKLAKAAGKAKKAVNRGNVKVQRVGGKCRSLTSGVSCVGSCKCGGRTGKASVGNSFRALLQRLGAQAFSEVLSKHGVSVSDIYSAVTYVNGPRTIEAGVVEYQVGIAGGGKVGVIEVDAAKVDPLSDYSPLPESVKSRLRLARISRQISELVDKR